MTGPDQTIGIAAEAQLDPAANALVSAGIALAALLIAAAIARRRSRSTDERPRFLRMLHAALFSAAAVSSAMIVEAILAPGIAEWILLAGLISFAVLAVVALILFAIVDFWLGLFRPRRTRKWLAASMIGFTTFAVAAMAAAVWLGDTSLTILLDPTPLAMAAIAAAAALVWWAYLPAPDPDAARAFD